MTVQKGLGPDWGRRYGPWALITGASDGIGRAMAHEAAERGLNLVLVARRADRLRDTARDLSDRFGTQSRIISGDLADPNFVALLIGETASLDIGLFVPAAGFGTAGALIDIDPANDIAMVDVNCRAVLQLTHAFARRMATRGSGGIIFFSSIVAFQGTAHAANYAATKGYIQLLAEGLRRELKLLGIDVLACAPGPVATGFAARSNLRMGRAENPLVVARETMQALGQQAIVRPGPLAKLLTYALATLPRGPRGAIMSSIMGGMTSHHQQAIKD